LTNPALFGRYKSKWLTRLSQTFHEDWAESGRCFAKIATLLKDEPSPMGGEDGDETISRRHLNKWRIP
jgi:hypothetical protein